MQPIKLAAMAGLLALSVSTQAGAVLNCGNDYVRWIVLYDDGRITYEVHKRKVISRVNRLAANHETPAHQRAEIISLLNTAIINDLQFSAVYPDGYNCNEDDTTTLPKLVYLSNPYVDRREQ